MLYLGSARAIGLATGESLSVEEPGADRAAVKKWIPAPHVYLLGAHTGCSCGFPHVLPGREPVEYFEGMFEIDEPGEREKDIRSAGKLVSLLTKQTTPGAPLFLYPVWEGEEDQPPKGVIRWSVDGLDARTLVLNERFLHEVAAGTS